MRTKWMKGCSAAALCIAVILNGIAAWPASAAEAAPAVQAAEPAPMSGYTDYLNHQADVPKADKSVTIPLETFSAAEGADIQITENVLERQKALVWNNGNGCMTADITVPKDALYEIKLSYLLPQVGVEPEIGIKIDGQYPFDGAESIVLPREWKNAGDNFQTDAQGNVLTPEQVETGRLITEQLRDHNGVAVENYLFRLTAGAHQLTICAPGQTLVLAAVAFAAPEAVNSYQKPEVTNQKLGVQPIVTEGEAAALKSSNTLVPLSDTGNAGMSPADAYKLQLNYIGGTAWNSPTDTLTWNIQVKHSGYYKLCFRYKQAELVNGESWRWLKIDGQTPFEECKSLRFAYEPRWDIFEFSDASGDPYLIYLEEGLHTVSLEGTLGEMAQYYARLSEVVTGLGDEYINIVKITGDSPDVNRDYELFRQIPDLNERLTEYNEKLSGIIKDLQSFTGKRGSQYIAAIQNMMRVADNMVKRPYNAHQYVKDYYTNYSTLSSWLYDMKNMPLSIDWFQFCPAEQEFQIKKTGFFSNFIFGTQRFIYSFIADYQLPTADQAQEQIRLWVNWGRDQTNVINTLIRDSFTAKKGISVKVEQTNASLINGILAGNFPDVSLNMARTDPVNLGIRGALTDLTEFEDCQKVLSRFQTGAELPYRYQGKLYALPDTQNFFVMFYRTDVLDNLGLSVPKNWKEFLETATVIQQNNMQVYVPYTQVTTATTVNAGVGGLHLFPTLMLQQGLSLYNGTQDATALTEPAALRVFEEWTDLYLDYQFVKEADFYNRFRVGTMPLGIAPYSIYLTLYDAAPEIKNRWAVANVPASEDGCGYVAGSGTGCGVVQKSAHQKAAWEFLKWWTDAETQTRYANQIESVLGMLGRPLTSNVEAFQNLIWDPQDKESLLEQWKLVREIPEIPGSYYLTRSVDQAYWQVINGKSNVKDAVVKWSRVADSEIERKLREYGK